MGGAHIGLCWGLLVVVAADPAVLLLLQLLDLEVLGVGLLGFAHLLEDLSEGLVLDGHVQTAQLLILSAPLASAGVAVVHPAVGSAPDVVAITFGSAASALIVPVASAVSIAVCVLAIAVVGAVCRVGLGADALLAHVGG